jgi:hypothetical protein
MEWRILAMAETTDLLIMWAVILARLLVPLTIPRYPLPGVIASSLLDMVDYTIIRDRTNLPMEGYQGFDKALDLYYLTIAYISMMRNWTNLFAFKLVRFLFYWRLAGVFLFEATQLRPLLFIFTNAFEYVFIFYEAMRLRWDPKKMGKWVMIGATAFIWIFIKLPQEYILHIGQFDTTVWVDAFFYALRTSFWVKVALVALVAVVVVFVRWLFRRLPPADYAPNLAADPLPAASAGGSSVKAGSERFFNSALLEKIVMVALVSAVFAQILPDVQSTFLQLAIGVAFIIIVNSALSHWLARRGTTWSSILRQFIVMAAVNFGLVLVYYFLLPNFEGSLNLGNTLFFVLMLTLLVTLYDRYRPVYLERFGDESG